MKSRTESSMSDLLVNANFMQLSEEATVSMWMSGADLEVFVEGENEKTK